VPPRAPLIGMVGELTGRKNHLALVRQLPALREQWPELRVWIAGRGPEERTLREEAERLGVAEAVSLLGFRRDVPALLDAVDLLVHPALMEGFGYVLVEAMAAGKPVVAAAASNIPEVVSEGETGLLFPPGDGAALRAAVARVLGDATLARTLGEAGRERVRREFSLPRMLDELEDYFTACAP
jgi:glycosyltransferase involved in cell wall biosynthesis